MSASLVGSEMCIRDRCEQNSAIRECAPWQSAVRLIVADWCASGNPVLTCLLYTSDAADDM
eukprot:11456377-Alexandrium_andersonii.AAC.1